MFREPLLAVVVHWAILIHTHWHTPCVRRNAQAASQSFCFVKDWSFPWPKLTAYISDSLLYTLFINPIHPADPTLIKEQEENQQKHWNRNVLMWLGVEHLFMISSRCAYVYAPTFRINLRVITLLQTRQLCDGKRKEIGLPLCIIPSLSFSLAVS